MAGEMKKDQRWQDDQVNAFLAVARYYVLPAVVE
jgi:hypothetical protein